MKIVSQPNSVLLFEKIVPKGTPLNDPAQPQLLVAEGSISHWGIIRSIEMGIERNGVPVQNISTYSIGTSSGRNGSKLKLQLWDRYVDSVQYNSYTVTATLNFSRLKDDKRGPFRSQRRQGYQPKASFSILF
jgi:hypothetical protein